ncbi:unnamed protein product [Adineta ricciae]|uniref:Uncharacterized protein n=1 Tax=Adineta ricciae TaxID=249248 RepID=A0A814P7Z9_ADIRI|nr:unnamed protein product [Adineta ricciae]
MLFGRREQHPVVACLGDRIDLELKALERADRLAIDRDGAVGADRDGQRGIALSRVAEQQREPPVDETLCERGVERVGQARFERLRLLGPSRRPCDPVAALRDEAERAHRGDAAGELVDIAFDIVQPREAAREPVGVDHPVAVRARLPQLQHGAAVMFGAQLLEIGQPADVPQSLHRIEIAAARTHFHIARQMLEHRDVDRFGCGAEHRLARRLRKIGQKLVERPEPRRWVTPEQAGERGEMMPLDRVDFLRREAALRQPDGAEAAVLLVAPGAAGDLCHFRNRQAAEAPPVEFLQARKGDMLDVEKLNKRTDTANSNR